MWKQIIDENGFQTMVWVPKAPTLEGLDNSVTNYQSGAQVDTKLVNKPDEKQVANYAALVALGTVTRITNVTVVADEKRGDMWTVYKLYPSGKRIFQVSLEDN